MKVYLRRDPWESLKAIEPLAPGFAQIWDVDGRGSPQVVVPFNSIRSPRLDGLLLPPSGFPFKYNDIIYQNYHLATTSVPGRIRQNVAGNLIINGSVYSIEQTNLLGRPHGRQRDDKIVINRHAWLVWQIQRYMELADYSDRNIEFESVFPGQTCQKKLEICAFRMDQ